MNKQKRLFQAARSVMQRLLDAGYEAYMVGGCVRDWLSGIPVADIDIATSAHPAEIISLFTHNIPRGINYGTIIVIMESYHFEVTTYRKEIAYEHYRRPKKVEFISDLTTDLRRRDFTINAIALDIEGKLYDPFGGQVDLKQRIVRCVGTASQRFQEDALRMLRGIRFVALLNGCFATATWEALCQQRKKLAHIAMERIGSEIWKLTSSLHPACGWALLANSELLYYTKENISAFVTLAKNEHIWGPLLTSLQQVCTPEQRLALLCLGQKINLQPALNLLQALRYSSTQQKNIISLLRIDVQLMRGGMFALATTTHLCQATRIWRQIFAQTLLIEGEDKLRASLTCRQALLQTGTTPKCSYMQPFMDHSEIWLQEIKIRHLQDIAINGADILRTTGRTAGSWVQKCLMEVWGAVALGEVTNEYDTLLAYVQKGWGQCD